MWDGAKVVFLPWTIRGERVDTISWRHEGTQDAPSTVGFFEDTQMRGGTLLIPTDLDPFEAFPWPVDDDHGPLEVLGAKRKDEDEPEEEEEDLDDEDEDDEDLDDFDDEDEDEEEEDDDI